MICRIVALAVCLPFARLAAQHTPADSNTARLATITTDTGAFAPGDTAFGRYTVPGVCLTAAMSAADQSRRTLAAQQSVLLLEHDPQHDTLPTAVIGIARRCGQRFTAAGVAPADLPDLFDLAVFEGNDTLAQAVLARRLTLVHADTARTQILQDAIRLYLENSPARVASAERIVAQLDAMGASARLARVLGHLQLLSFGNSTFDSVRIRREAEQIIALAKPVHGEALQLYSTSLWTAYRSLMAAAFFQSPDSMLTVARRAQPDLGRIPPPPGYHNPMANEPIEKVVAALSPVADWKQMGHPTPSLRAVSWFPDTARERTAGHVSLLISFPWDCYVSNRMALGRSVGCPQLINRIRQVQSMYGPAGLTITIASVPSEYVLLRGPLSVADATKDLDWYIHTYLALPVRLAVLTRPPYTAPLPPPDNRRFRLPDSASFDKQYGLTNDPQSEPMVVLADRNGRQVYAGAISPLFDILLRRTVTGTTTSTSPSTKGQGQ